LRLASTAKVVPQEPAPSMTMRAFMFASLACGAGLAGTAGARRFH